MALEHTINEESFTGLDKAIQAHYEKDGDNYHLQAVGLVPKSRLDEFRDNNIKLKAANEKFETEMTDLQSQLEAASKGVDEGKVDALVEEKLKKRVAKMQEDHDKTVADLTDGKSKAEGTLSKMLVSDTIAREAVAAGVQETALDDVIARANNTFKVVDGKAVPYDGDDVMYGTDGKTPLTPKDWLAGQAVTAPHLFKSSDGAGAKNEHKGGGAGSTTLTSTQKIAAGLKEL